MKTRVTWMSGGIYLMLLVILSRLFYVSLVMGPELRAESQNRVIERKIIHAKRGDIYSADGSTFLCRHSPAGYCPCVNRRPRSKISDTKPQVHCQRLGTIP
jgi:hypothetical protein